MHIIIRSFFAGLLGFAALGVSAVPLSFDFSANNAISLSGSPVQGTSTVGGITVTVSGGIQTTVPTGGVSFAAADVVKSGSNGLGVKLGGSSPQIDGSGSGGSGGVTISEDFLQFTFSEAVSLDAITFKQVANSDFVTISYLTAGNVWTSLATYNFPSTAATVYDINPDLLSTAFRVTADYKAAPEGHDSHFYVAGLSFDSVETKVPEPSGIALVGLALVGLVAARRRA